jgi:imidazolonepropionase-like amidohydrolase
MIALRAPAAYDGERFLPGGATVLVEGDHIVGVEAPGFTPPDGVEVREYAGTLLPGLVDAHVHLVGNSEMGGLEAVGGWSEEEIDATIGANLATLAASGVTTVRDLGDRGYRSLVARDARRPGEPRIVAAGPPLTTPGGHCHWWGGAVTPDRLERAVAEHAERGVDVIKVMASGGMNTVGTDVMGIQFEEAELRTVVAAAHGRGLRVLAHAHSLAGAWTAARAGVDGIEHFTCLTPEGSVVDQDLVAALAAAGISVDPTVGRDAARMPDLSQAPPQLRELVERLGLTVEQGDAFRREQLLALAEQGVRLVTGLDAGVGPAKAHGSSWRAVTQTADAVGVAAALASATSVAAEDCGLGGVTGVLRAGLSADLLVVDGDVEHDVDALSRPLLVLVRGEEVVARLTP